MNLWDSDFVESIKEKGIEWISHKPIEFINSYIYSRAYYDYSFFINHFFPHFKNKPKSEWNDLDKEQFEKGITPRYKIPKFHLEILDAYSKSDNICSIFARGSGKTTLVIVSDLHDILYSEHKDMTEMLLLSTKENKDKVLKAVREEIENNQRIKNIFGDLQPSQSSEERNKFWNNSDLYFRNGVKYHGRSKGGVVRGIRARKIVVDDPQSNREVRSKAVAQETIKWFYEEVVGTADIQCKIIVQGTDLGEDCLVRTVYENQKNGFKKFSMPAITDCVIEKGEIIQGEALWPERFSVEWFQNKLDITDQRSFEQEYLNVTSVLNSNPVFESSLDLSIKEKVEELSGYNIYTKLDPNKERLVIGIDTASGESHDNSAISVRGELSKELVATFNGKCTLEELAQKVNMWFEMGFYCYVIPETNYSDYFISLLREYFWFYTYVYRQKRDPNDVKGRLGDYGVRTTTKTKQMYVDIYGKNLRENSSGIRKKEEPCFVVTKELAQQIKYFERDGVKMNARQGQFDDLLMADMICCYGIERYNNRM